MDDNTNGFDSLSGADTGSDSSAPPSFMGSEQAPPPPNAADFVPQSAGDTTNSSINGDLTPPPVQNAPVTNLQPANQPISWRDVLRGALAGMAGAAQTNGRGGFAQGVGAGAGAAMEEQRKDQQVQMQQQRLQFESAQAADSHIAALDTHKFMQTKDAEAKLGYKKKQGDFQNMMQTEFGIEPNLSFADTDANAIAAHDTTAAGNGGTIPPAYTSQKPEPDGTHGTIAVYSPTQAQYQSNLAGFRDLVNTGRAINGQPPLKDDEVNQLGFKGMRDASIATQKMLSPTIDSNVSEANLPAQLAKAKQRLAVYAKSPNAKPEVVKALGARVKSTESALTDTQTQAANAAGAKTKAEDVAKMSTPEELAKPGAQAAIQSVTDDPTTSPQVKVQMQALLPKATVAQNNVANMKQRELQATQAVTQGSPDAAGKLLADRTITLEELKSRSVTPQFIASAVQAAQKYDPNFKAPIANAQAKIAGSAANQQFFGNTDSLLVKGGTLDQVDAAGKALNNKQIPKYNTYANLAAQADGKTPQGQYAASVLAVADDYAKVMGGSIGTDAARKQVIDLSDAAQNDAQRADVIAQVKQGVLSQRRGRQGTNPYLKDMYPEVEQSQAPQPTQSTQQSNPTPQQNAPRQQAIPPRPPGAPANYIYNANGPKGPGYYKP